MRAHDLIAFIDFAGDRLVWFQVLLLFLIIHVAVLRLVVLGSLLFHALDVGLVFLNLAEGVQNDLPFLGVLLD